MKFRPQFSEIVTLLSKDPFLVFSLLMPFFVIGVFLSASLSFSYYVLLLLAFVFFVNVVLLFLIKMSGYQYENDVLTICVMGMKDEIHVKNIKMLSTEVAVQPEIRLFGLTTNKIRIGKFKDNKGASIVVLDFQIEQNGLWLETQEGKHFYLRAPKITDLLNRLTQDIEKQKG